MAKPNTIKPKAIFAPTDMPQSNEVEIAVLGSILTNPSLYAQAISMGITHDDFYNSRHGDVFKAMGRVVDSDIDLNYATLVSDLEITKENGKPILELVGGEYFIVSLISGLHNSYDFVSYGLSLKRASERREKMRLIENAAGLMLSGASLDDITNLMSGLLIDNAPQMDTGEISIQDALNEQYETAALYAKARIANNGITPLLGIATPFNWLNEMTDGWQAGKAYIVTGRPAAGKTSLMMQAALVAAQALATNNAGYVVYYCLEMTRADMVARLTSMLSGVSARDIRKGAYLGLPHDESKWTPYQRQMGLKAKAVMQAEAVLRTLPMIIVDKGSVGVTETSAHLTQFTRKRAVKWVGFDGLYNAKADGQNEYESLGKNIAGLVRMAKDFDVPMVISHQVDKASFESVTLASLKGNAAIQALADTVIGVYQQSQDDPHSRVLQILKNRSGAVGNRDFVFDGETTTFIEPKTK